MSNSTARITKVEQADGYVSITLDKDVTAEIEAAREFEPTSVFETANGGVEFCLFTDESFSVGDTFVNGEWVKALKPEGDSTKMKSQGLGYMYSTLDRINSEKY